jgi:hypothetical protein
VWGRAQTDTTDSANSSRGKSWLLMFSGAGTYWRGQYLKTRDRFGDRGRVAMLLIDPCISTSVRVGVGPKT